MWHPKWYTVSLIFFSCLFFPQYAFSHHILVLNSYHKGFPWTDNIVRGIESTLDDDTDLVVEYMDSKAIKYDSAYKEVLYKLYAYKYGLKKFNIIIATDDNAFNFLREYHKELFPNTPIIFCGVNNLNASNLIDKDWFTGILEISAEKETLDLILKLHPETKQIAIVTDSTPSGRYRWSQLEPFFSLYPSIEFTRISDSFSIEEIEDKISKLSDSSVVIFSTLYRDKTGRYISLAEGVARISKSSNRPIYTFHTQVLKYGTIGGKLLGGFHHGEEAAKIALSILSGEKPINIPIVDYSTAEYMFDHNQLKRFGIKSSDLPKESIVVDVPKSLYKDHKIAVWLAILVGIVMSVLIVLFYFNIGSRKALRKSKEIMGSVLDTAPIGISIYDREGQCIVANDAMAQMVGGTKEKVLAQNYNTIESWKISGALDKVKTAIKENINQRHELIAKSTFGQEVKLDCYFTPLSSGNLVLMAHDITERIKIETELRESENRFRELSENIKEAFWIFDWKKEKVLYVSRAYEEIWGRSAKALLKDYGEWGQSIHPDDMEYANISFQKLIETGSGRRKYRITRPDGVVRWISDRGFVIYDGNMDPMRIVGICEDITEQEYMAEEREKMEARLQQAKKMETIGTLAGGIAHDFNNILSPVIGLSEIVRMDFAPEDPNYKSISTILEAGLRGKELVQQILAVGRKNTQLPENSFIPIQLQKTLTGILKLGQATIPDNVSITMDIDKDCQAISANPAQIHQIVMNIITNAYHALEETGGEIKIGLKEVIVGVGDIGTLEAGNYAALSISDTGCGMTKEVKNRIFEPYFTTKSADKGTGLGLSVAYSIIKELGGEIKVYSEEGRGAIFNVFLPSVQDVESPYEVVSSLETGDEKILVVDDEEPITYMAKGILERLGYKVTSTTDSKEALREFMDNPYTFDLLLTDMTMPGIMGDDLARKILSIRPEFPVVLMTGFSTRIDKEKCNEMGIKGFILKPITTSEMANVIRTTLDLSSTGG